MARDFFYKLYSTAHKAAKIILNRKTLQQSYRMVNINPADFEQDNSLRVIGSSYINDIVVNKNSLIQKKDVFPVENIIEINSNTILQDSFKKRKQLHLTLGIEGKDANNIWESFIDASIISEGYKYAGLHYAGYISSHINEWCLPSWIWTNAALVRLYSKKGDLEKATNLANLLAGQQQEDGGWIVRYDYDKEGPIPVLAPNDSAYIANNAFLELYKVTQNEKYLKIAEKCAYWIMETARPDGFVWVGFDMKRKSWQKKYNIVDIGFTAGLFAKLYEITLSKKYKSFLSNFVELYIKLFYIPSQQGFTTSIKESKQIGGMFARGQAWALEGLISAYKVLQSDTIKKVIQNTVNTLLEHQLKNGGWSYNLTRPLMGEDAKAVSVIAKNLLEWNKIEKSNNIIISAQKALNWCLRHTSNKGISKGGIFSFSVEGAIVHNHYTSTAFVYASAYAIELNFLLPK